MSVRILSIDTAASIVSVAVTCEGNTFELTNNEANKHTECVIGMIDDVLKKAGLSLPEITAIAFGAGPGAFTGLRVACGIAQGLAWAKDLPVLCVSNLEAAAIRAKIQGRILIALDARMHECYVGVYDISPDHHMIEVLEPQLVKPAELAQLCVAHSVCYVAGSGLKAYEQEITLPEGLKIVHTDCATAADIARRAITLQAEGKSTTSALAAPLYVRNRVALTIQERAEGQRL